MNNKEELRIRAFDIAKQAHKGQVDKAGVDYIEHPMRVSKECKSIDAKIVAMLHDTIEDSDITPTYLLDRGFPQHIVDAVVSITKKSEEDYSCFILRAKGNAIGREVKICDIIDNLNLNRLEVITLKDLERANKYINALKVLID